MEDRSNSPLFRRSSGPESLTKIAIITGAVIGSVVIIISLCALLVRHHRRQTLKKDEEQDRGRDASHRRERLLEEQRQHWDAQYEEGDIPPQRLLTYRHEFWNLTEKARDAMIPVPLKRRWSDDATILADDDTQSNTYEDRATHEAERRFVMQRWWEDHGQHAASPQLDHGVQSSEFNNSGSHSSPMPPTRHLKLTDDVELGVLQSPISPHAHQDMPPRASSNSNIDAVAPQRELNREHGHNPSFQVYLADRDSELHDMHNALDNQNVTRPGLLGVPDVNRSRAAPSMISSAFSGVTWNMPDGFGYRRNTARHSINTEAETILSHDEYRGDARRNREERRRRELQEEQGREAKEHEDELRDYEVRRNLNRAKNGDVG
ncbi:hypothetical protein FKW77_006395 [Venturia effusa]|uniref:Uncharacterized protein n=1 Tax=Venturia effusa TaxID=50376 RepID=A0A517KWK3_9PEZI|nr:hypothetical protein FKW77_006395 [Venturia effusa]